MEAHLSYEERLFRLKEEEKHAAAIIQAVIDQAQADKELAITEVYRLQKEVIKRDQTVIQQEEKLRNSRKCFQEIIEKVQQEERTMPAKYCPLPGEGPSSNNQPKQKKTLYVPLLPATHPRYPS
jgi:hypothetical protein